VLKALEKDSKDRIQTMEEFFRLLVQVPSGSTLMGEGQPMVGRDRGSAMLSATSARAALLSSAAEPAFTTLSSTIGQVRSAGHDAPARRGVRRIVLVGVGALALAALAFGVGLKLWNRPAAPGPAGQRPEKSAAAAVQPILPLIAPPPAPVSPPTEPRVPAQAKLPEPADNRAVAAQFWASLTSSSGVPLLLRKNSLNRARAWGSWEFW
jgi:hypothetical protein